MLGPVKVEAGECQEQWQTKVNRCQSFTNFTNWSVLDVQKHCRTNPV